MLCVSIMCSQKTVHKINTLCGGHVCSHVSSWKLNYSMEQSPSQKAGKKISYLLQNLTVHYCIHSRWPLNPTLSQMNPVHTLTLYFS